MFQILKGKYDHRVTDFIPLNRSGTGGHHLKIFKQHTWLNARKCGFIQYS